MVLKRGLMSVPALQGGWNEDKCPVSPRPAQKDSGIHRNLRFRCRCPRHTCRAHVRQWLSHKFVQDLGCFQIFQMLPDRGVDWRVIKMANEIKLNLVSLLTNESKRCNMEAPTQASLPSGNPRSTSYLINRPPTSRNCLIVKHATRADRTVSCNKSWNKAGVIPRETSFSHCLHIRPQP